MQRLIIAVALLTLCTGVASAQKGKAEPDYYPLGYAQDTWTGEVTAFDNDQRTLTLTDRKSKTASTFVASIPDAPYEWARDAHNAKVLDFPYDKESNNQVFKYEGEGFAGSVIPSGRPGTSGMFRRPNPPAENQITDFADFMGRVVTVYYTARERKVGDQAVKYNDVWRVRILTKKK